MEVPAVELIDVHTTLGDTWVLRGVSFAVPTDRITVLLGPSGVGKTTCIRHITGLLLPDAGDILVEGRSRAQMVRAEHNALARRFGVLIQGSGLYSSALWGSMSVVENVMFQLRALTNTPEDELREAAMGRLEEVGLAAHADVMPGNLSAGMSKRVALARALASDPDFAVLDSFDHGIDPVRLGRLCSLIRWHHDQHPATYIVTTHDMEVAERLADHAVILYDGRVVEEGPADQVFASDRAEVRQFVSGDVEGPLGLRSDTAPLERRPFGEDPGETDMHIPIPLAAICTLLALTTGILLIWRARPLEVALVIALWVVTVMVLVARYERSR